MHLPERPTFRIRLAGLGLTWPQLCQSIQTMVAAVAAYAVAIYFELPQGYWSVMTAMLVVQASVGASLGLAFDRLIATILGGTIGGILVALFGEARFPLLATSVLVLAYIATVRSSLRLAPVTAAIVILSDPHYGSAVASAINRVIEIGLGAVIAILTTLLVFPSRAGAALAGHVGRTLPMFAEHLELTLDTALGRPRSGDDFLLLNSRVRAALMAGEALATEARRELAGHIADHADPAAVLRTMRRTWYTLMMAARATQKPLPPVAIKRLRQSLSAVSEAGPDMIRQLAATYSGQPSSIDLHRLMATLSAVDDVMGMLRRSGELQELSTDDAARVFTFAFALGQLPQNLGDLRDRYDDLASKATVVPAAPPSIPG